jgi:nitrite reductase (NADH) large subunit
MADPIFSADRLVVIGHGLVGHAFCQQAVALGLHRSLRLVVIGEEPHLAYDRIRLASCLAGTPSDQLILADQDWYRDHGIEVRTGVAVAAIDRQRRRIRLADEELGWAQLVLSTGSRAARPNAVDISHSSHVTRHGPPRHSRCA